MRRGLLAAAAATALIVAAWWWWILRPGREAVALVLFGREVILLAPRRLLVLAVLPWVWFGRSLTLTDLPRAQTALSAIVRSLLIAAVAIALARPASPWHSSRVSAVFLVDASDSVSDDQLEASRRFVEEARRHAAAGEAHLVTFARRPRVVALGDQPLAPIERHAGAGDATNVEAAMQLGTALFAPATLRRLVLLSDGRETEGATIAEAYRAAAAGVRIDVSPLPGRARPEIVLHGLSLPPRITVGRPFEVAADIVSTHAGEATLWLEQDGLPNPLDPRRAVALAAGANHVRLRSLVRHAGHVSYRARIDARGPDTFDQNNHQIAAAVVSGRPRVLVCDGEPERAGAFADALRAESLDVEVRGPHGVPTALRDLERWDLLVLSDVPPVFFGPDQAAAVETWVRDLGGGFLFAAGPSASGEGLAGSRLERLLPVRFGTERKRDEPVLALALVVDKSGSMAGQKIELAKEAARATADLLAPSDLIGVIAFDSQPSPVVRLQRAAARARIAGDIARIVASGGTSILPALQGAFAELQPARARIKHVILLSDGQSSYNGIRELVDEMAQSRITVSTVGVGDGADRTLLGEIAEWGGGRFYFTQDASNVPRIFTKETTEVARSALVEEAVGAVAVKRADVIGGIDLAAAPPLRGYVATKPKPLGEVIVASQQGEPLLARWRVGLGKVAAWTSDLKPRWSAPWIGWTGFARLWAQVARDTMRARASQRFDLRAEVVEGVARVEIDAVDRTDRFVDGLEGELVAIDPERPSERRSVALRQIAPGRYAAEVPARPAGALILRADLRRDGKPVGEATGAVAAGYPAEYADLTPEPRLGDTIARVTGGRVGVAPADVFDPRGERVRFEHDLWPGAIGIAALLLLLDVLLRRVRLFGRKAVST